MPRFRSLEIVLLVLALGLLTLRPRCGPGQEPTSEALVELTKRLHQRLDDAKRRLAAGDAGPATQAAQTDVVETLDRLIVAAQRQEAAQRSDGGAGASGASTVPKENSPRDIAAAESTAQDDPSSKPGQGPSGDGSPGAWGRLPQREREALLQSLRDRGFPPRYRTILEQYYRSFHPSDARRGKPGPASRE